MSKYKQTLPNTFLLGFQKAGTTALYNWVGQHPEVYGEPSMKEYNFFGKDDLYSLGLPWFKRSFSKYQNQKIVLHGYVKYINEIELIAPRLREVCEEPKLILIVRDPVARAYSAYWEAKKTGREFRPSFEAAIFHNGKVSVDSLKTDEDYIKDSLYEKKIRRLFDFFEPHEVHLMSFEGMKQDPIGTVKSLYVFLGIDENFQPNLSLVNEAGVARSNTLQKIFQSIKAPLFIKKVIPGSKLSLIKSFLIRSLNNKKTKYPGLRLDTKDVLELYFIEDYKETKKLIE